MNSAFETRETWSADFFADFLRTGPADPRAPSLRELEALWGPGRGFDAILSWKAWLARDAQGKPTARALVSAPKNAPRFLSLGYFEANDRASGTRLLEAVVADCTERADLPDVLRGPIDGNFFNRYRLKLRDDGRSFFTEPPLRSEYAETFRAAGFARVGTWKTLDITAEEAARLFEPFWKRIADRWNESETTLRPLRLHRWEEELRELHRILHESFSSMPNFEPLPWEIFYAIYGDLKYVIDPELIVFAEKRGSIEGFAIGLPDPSAIIDHVRELSSKYPRARALWSLLGLARLKMPRAKTRFLILYLGKTKGSRAPWLGAVLGRRMMQLGLARGYDRASICFVADKSPIYTTLPTDLTCVAEYGLFERKLR